MGFVFSLILAAAAADAKPVEIPDDLKNIYSQNLTEDQIVSAVRNFDVVQTAMAKWDEDMVAELVAKKDKAEADLRLEHMKERYRAIEQAYKTLLEHYPNNARAQNYYGEFLYDIRVDTAGAVQAWKLASSLDSKYSLPYNNLGLYYCHVGEYELGVHNLDKAMELDAKNPDIMFNLAQIYLVNFPEVEKIRKWNGQKTYSEAMRLSKRAAELKPDDFSLWQDYAVNFFAADRFNVQPNWQEAAAAWQKAREKAQHNYEVFYTWLNEGRIWMRKPDWARAESCVKEALKIYPDNQVAKDLLQKIQTKSVK